MVWSMELMELKLEEKQNTQAKMFFSSSLDARGKIHDGMMEGEGRSFRGGR